MFILTKTPNVFDLFETQTFKWLFNFNICWQTHLLSVCLMNKYDESQILMNQTERKNLTWYLNQEEIETLLFDYAIDELKDWCNCWLLHNLKSIFFKLTYLRTLLKFTITFCVLHGIAWFYRIYFEYVFRFGLRHTNRT